VEVVDSGREEVGLGCGAGEEEFEVGDQWATGCEWFMVINRLCASKCIFVIGL
jgi:hypothetical protein